MESRPHEPENLLCRSIIKINGPLSEIVLFTQLDVLDVGREVSWILYGSDKPQSCTSECVNS